jgi:hypothetical protein
MTPSGIEPMTFQLVAQCLNQLCHQQRVLIISRRVLNSMKHVLLVQRCEGLKKKVKQSHHRSMGLRGFWEVKAPRFRDIST